MGRFDVNFLIRSLNRDQRNVRIRLHDSVHFHRQAFSWKHCQSLSLAPLLPQRYHVKERTGLICPACFLTYLMCACMCVSQRLMSSIFPWFLPPLVFETGSLAESKVNWFGWVGWSNLPVLELQISAAIPSFFLGPRDLNSGQVAWMAGILLGAISSGLEVEFYTQKIWFCWFQSIKHTLVKHFLTCNMYWFSVAEIKTTENTMA